MYPKDKISNIKANCDKYDWAGKTRDAVTSAAQPWLAKSDDELWRMVPGQDLPRTIDVTWDYNYTKNPQLGCLKCGKAINNFGNYPYDPDFDEKPWKLTCPSCGVVFPTNDFGKYYESGIDEQGLFNPKKADRSLLFNTDHPDPKDPLHDYGVDDGFGYVDANGRAHKFIGYYAWKYWRHIYSGLQKLSDAYLYTGDKRYAHKAAVLLDRIADVYPAMDWNPYAERGWYHSDGSGKTGKIEGRIWETSTIQQFARAYDKIISGTVDDAGLYDFLRAKSKEYKLPGKKGSRADLIANIDSGILETAAKALMSGQIRGNEGMHQSSMACCAIALNTEPKTSQWLDWLFLEKGGNLPTVILQKFDRDGMADEAAPGYCYLWPGKILEIMAILEPYEAYQNHRLSRDYPYLRNSFTAPGRVTLLNTFMPNVGDTGAAGTIVKGASPALVAAGFKFFNDDTAARFAWELNGHSAKGLLVDLGSTTPDILNEALERAALKATPKKRWGENMAGYGLASFEFGDDAAGKALWLYYGRNSGHGHLDRLNYSIYAFGADLTPDLGYPEFANKLWPRRAAWNNNTISHNTVVVDKEPQQENWTGYPVFYTSQPGFGVTEISSPNVYPTTTEYKRTLAFIGAPGDNAYAVDIFRVTGGRDHLLSFHGPEGAVTATGISLTRQTTGTYAGEAVPYGDNSPDHPYGYSYLENVERAQQPDAGFSLDWKAATGYRGVKESDDIHMRLHVLNAVDDVALADGIPAPNKPGNPERLRYALLHRNGGDAGGGSGGLSSTFVTAAEPWKDSPVIDSITSCAVQGSGDAVALRVALKGDATDWIISNPAMKSVSVRSDDQSELITDGAFAWVRTVAGRVTSASLTRGTSLKFGDVVMKESGDVRGELVRFERDRTKPAWAWLKVTAGDPASMKGAQIIIENDSVRNACYDVLDVKRDGELWRITCGPGSFVRGFVDEDDYSKGLEYNIHEGAHFYAPITWNYRK